MLTQCGAQEVNKTKPNRWEICTFSCLSVVAKQKKPSLHVGTVEVILISIMTKEPNLNNFFVALVDAED